MAIVANTVGMARFATGGSFDVDGNGAADSQYINFLATPGERVTVETPVQQSSGGGDTYVTHVHVSTGVAQTVRAEVMNMFPQIEQVTRAGMIDAKRRNKLHNFR